MTRFEILLVDEIPALRRYARALCGDIGQADDLVQECLLRAVSRRRLWISRKGMRPWLFTILHNIFVNTLSRQIRSPIAGSTENHEHAMTSEDNSDQLCTQSDFEKALLQLSSDQREVLLLVGLEQISYRDVAKIVGVPVGTVMSRLSRAREHLRKNLEGEVKLAKIKCVK
ncbi:MAG: RNA polymerase sigma factor [Gammaproteobacteria bacterium]|nr:RNA polymerase sigma factor [Gammaproteobacteria bacterium]MDH3448593.1 RNA polymerase sigma factor [Gammaproteobacteria bacterium]